MAIQVDDAFLDSVIAINRQLESETAASPNGPIEGLVIKPGTSAFGPGQNLATLIRQHGTEIKARLDQLATQSGTRGNQLFQYRQMADQTESMNEMSMQEFGTSLPGFANPS